jgi:hypothetical protein
MSRLANRLLAPVLAAFALSGLLAPAANAAPRVTLQAGLLPLRLGAPTTVSVGFRVAPGPDGELSPLSGFSLRLPSGMGLAASRLGLATCSSAVLLARGAPGCPHESLIGFGSARVRVPFGTQVVRESGRVLIFMARPVERHTTALFYFDGRTPVIAPLVLQSEIVTPAGSADSVLRTPIPPIRTAPEGPLGELLSLHVAIGPPGLRYFKRLHHRRVAYHPTGIAIPGTCPRGGFAFAAGFRFQDGSRTKTRTAVPCPATAGRSARPE